MSRERSNKDLIREIQGTYFTYQPLQKYILKWTFGRELTKQVTKTQPKQDEFFSLIFHRF